MRHGQRVLLVAVAALIGLAYRFSDPFRFEVGRAAHLLGSGDLESLREYILGFGAWAPVVSLGLMVFQALATPIPSFLISFANGLAFGPVWGWLLSAVGHVLAAAVCFGLARALGRGPVTALVGRVGLESTDRWFGRWGAHAVLVTRLVPGMAFDAVSYAAGLTQMGFGRFIGATTIGVLPGTLVHALLGHHAPQYAWVPLAATGVVVAGGAITAVLSRRRAIAARLFPRQGDDRGEDGGPPKGWIFVKNLVASRAAS